MSEENGESHDGSLQSSTGRRRRSRRTLSNISENDRHKRSADNEGREASQQDEGEGENKDDGDTLKNIYRDSDWGRELPQLTDEPWRRPVARDFARVTHSVSFRRLQGKTQVFPGHESDYFRNRLTHSLEVAQIAEGIADKINYEHENKFGKVPIDSKLCATAALMHDLGHPPFGHNGERALDDRMRQYGGFEGNAQTLRIISRLEKKVIDRGDECEHSSYKKDKRLGLNLSYRTIASILKYDHEIEPTRSSTEKLVKGYYASESDLVKRVKQAVEPGWVGKFKTVECAIMDIADDIAYSTYDLEDCLKAGFLSPAEILASPEPLLRRVADKVSANLTKERGKTVKVTRENILSVFYDIFKDLLPKSLSKFRLAFMREEQLTLRRIADAVGLFEASRELSESGYRRTALSSQLYRRA
nr:dNTP triphosphohydrolase [Methylobacterium indicum]